MPLPCSCYETAHTSSSNVENAQGATQTLKRKHISYFIALVLSLNLLADRHAIAAQNPNRIDRFLASVQTIKILFITVRLELFAKSFYPNDPRASGAFISISVCKAYFSSAILSASKIANTQQ